MALLYGARLLPIVYDGKNKLFLPTIKICREKESSLFYWNFENGFIDTARAALYLENQLIKNAKKYEDFARTPDGKYIFFNYRFDRIKPGSNRVG
jgi:hypothetical protein